MPRGHGRGPNPRRRWGRKMRIVEPLVLVLLTQNPAHGYHIIEQLAERFGVGPMPPQTVYRTLRDMEAHGWVTAVWDPDSAQGPPRKVYQVTNEGLHALDSWLEEIEALQQTLTRFLEVYRKVRLE